MVRCILLSAKLPKSFWGEAVHIAAYLINRSPLATLNFKVPEEIWTGVPPDFRHLRIFGCTTYAHISQGKLEPRARKYLFLGYLDGVKGYKLWYREVNLTKVLISRDIVFREDQMYMDDSAKPNQQPTKNMRVSEQVELQLPGRSFGQRNKTCREEQDQEEQVPLILRI